jgi:hypothetical protein
MAGEWWTTPHELMKIYDYFARDGAAFSDGRQQGKGILQAVLVVRHEWGQNSPDHLGLVAAIELKQGLKAMYGEGDVAPDASQKSNLKPIRLTDDLGRQRGVYQLFLPEAWNYASQFIVLERDCPTDSDLVRLAKRYDTGPLSFEVP